MCFARGTFGGKQALIMVAGPVLTLELLKQLRAEINTIFDEKESQLKQTGDSDGPSVLVAPIQK